MERQHTLAVISITPNGNALAQRLARSRQCDCYTSDKLLQTGFIPFEGSFSQCVERIFLCYSSILFICATGIVIRTIAPLLVSKQVDPAVLVMDEQGKHVISLLSGHVGGANQLTLDIAQLMNADSVITTATDVNQVAALDMIAQAMNADVVNYRESVKLVNHMLVSDKRVGLYQQHAQVNDSRGFIIVDDLQQLPELDLLVWVSFHQQLPTINVPVVQVIPRCIVAGIGCRRETPVQALKQQLETHCHTQNIHLSALTSLGSVDIKQDEQGLLQLAQQLNLPLSFYSADELAPHQHHFPQSEFVHKTLGIGSVSQPVAWLMSHGHLYGETLKQQGITITLGVIPCCMS